MVAVQWGVSTCNWIWIAMMAWGLANLGTGAGLASADGCKVICDGFDTGLMAGVFTG